MSSFRESEIEIRDTGKGPPLLFVPGSYSTAAAWRPLQTHLPSTLRFVSTSLRGYGTTQETRTADDLGMEHETSLIKTIADEIGEPVHLVGHSFGATVALATALDRHVNVISLSVFEPNPLNLIRDGGRRELFSAVQRMSDAFERAHASGDPDAPARIIDFWDGTGSFDALPAAVQDYCRSSAHTNVLDWHTDYRFRPKVEDYEALGVPVLLVRGALANEAMTVMTNLLDSTLPNARLVTVSGAAHSLVSTHARECAAVLRGFYASEFGL